ncbi:MAG: hypothetical protein ACFFGZ_00375 [Candidatus Thorarchaeota archaeon]
MKDAKFIVVLLMLMLGIGSAGSQWNAVIPLETTPVSATTVIPTFCTIHPNRSVVWPDEILQLTVHVVTPQQQGIDSGVITISNLNTSWSDDYTFSSASGGKITVLADVTAGEPVGKHIWQANYQGDVGAGYQASNGLTVVEYVSNEPSGLEPCKLAIDRDADVVFTNASFVITVNVTSENDPSPFFGGNIAIIAPMEDIVLASYLVPAGFYFEVSATLDVSIPLWFPPGIANLTAHFIDTKGTFFPASLDFQMDVLDVGHDVALTVSPSTINRVDDAVTIRVDFSGDSAIGKYLHVGLTDEITNWTIASRTIASNPEIITWNADYSFALGPYRIWAELQNPLTGLVYAYHNRPITIFDYVALDWSANTTNPAPGDVIAFSLTTTQQDIPTLAVPSRVLITDSEEGLIGNVTTDALGLGLFEWNISLTTPGGNHTLNFTATPLDTSAGVLPLTFWGDLAVQSRTQLQLSYPAQIQRGQTLTVSYQLSVESQDPVTEGEIYFDPPYDSLQNQTVNGAGNGQFDLAIPLDHPVGPQSFSITYGGTDAYSSANQTILITVFSELHFNSLHTNASPVLPGQTLRIFGQLLDETNQGISEQTVACYLSDSTAIGAAITQGDGSFAINWIVPVDATPGLAVLSVVFVGNVSGGYLPPTSQAATTTVLISNEIALEVPSVVIMETNTTLKVHGGYGTNVSIWWQDSTDSTWHLIAENVSIPSIGVPYEINWAVPLYRGPLTLRMTNSLDLTVFAATSVYEEPQYSFPSILSLVVDEEHWLNASCSASYRILVDGVPVTAWQTADASLPISFALRGLHTLTMEISEEYVLTKTITANITVYEPVTVLINAPTNIAANTTALIDITVTSSLPGGQPLSGKDIRITLYDLTRLTTLAEYSTSLDAKGKAQIITEVLPRGSYEVSVLFLPDQDWFKESLESVPFHAVGQATLEFVPPSFIVYNETVTLITTLSDTLGAINDEIITFWWRIGEGDWNYIGESATSSSGEARFDWIPLLQPGEEYYLKAELVATLDLEYVSVAKPVEVTPLAITPPTVLKVWPLLPTDSNQIIASDHEFAIVAQVHEQSAMTYTVQLAVNDQKREMLRQQADSYTFQMPNGTAYFIPANGDVLFVGTLSFLTEGTYEISVVLEDEGGNVIEVRPVDRLQVLSENTATNTTEPPDTPIPDNDEDGQTMAFSYETVILLLLAVGSSGTVAFISRPRRQKR